jgi:hypothetical protein
MRSSKNRNMLKSIRLRRRPKRERNKLKSGLKNRRESRMRRMKD